MARRPVFSTFVQRGRENGHCRYVLLQFKMWQLDEIVALLLLKGRHLIFWCGTVFRYAVDNPDYLGAVKHTGCALSNAIRQKVFQEKTIYS